MTKDQLKLKTAAEEIKDILRKHDIAASMLLHTPGHSEYVNHLLTSYSCAYQYEDESIRFYCKSKEFKTKDEQINKLSATSNMLKMLTDGVGSNFMMLEPLSRKFDGLVNAKHKTEK